MFAIVRLWEVRPGNIQVHFLRQSNDSMERVHRHTVI